MVSNFSFVILIGQKKKTFLSAYYICDKLQVGKPQTEILYSFILLYLKGFRFCGMTWPWFYANSDYLVTL